MMSRFMTPAKATNRNILDAQGNWVGRERKSSVNLAENMVAQVINMGDAKLLKLGELGQSIWKPIPVSVSSMIAIDRMLRM